MIKKSNRPEIWLWLFNTLTCSFLYFKVVTRSQTSEKLLWDASTSRILLPKDSSLYSTQSIHTYQQTAYHPLMTPFFSFFLSNLIHHFVCLLVHSKLLFTFFCTISLFARMKILVGEKLNGYGDVIKIPYETSKGLVQWLFKKFSTDCW